DSILSIPVGSRARKAGFRLTAKELFVHQTIAELAQVVTVADAEPEEAEAVVGSVPLTPIQQWFFASERANPQHFNQSALLELTEELDVPALDQALRALVVQHDALRMRFDHVDGRWQQYNAPVDDAPVLDRRDVSDVD